MISRPTATRVAAAITALVALGALGLQLVLLKTLLAAQGFSFAQSLWRFLGYFTLLTNIGAAIVTGMMAVSPNSRFAGPHARFATAVSIAVVGLVYSIALRAAWNPTGWQAVADHALHDATPLMFLTAWALSDHGRLRWRDALWGALPPALYCVYAFIRGVADGWYAYWFLNPARMSMAQLAGTMGVLLTGVLLVAITLLTVDRWLGRATPSLRRTIAQG